MNPDILTNAETAMRPELENHAVNVLGHKHHFIRRHSVAQLRKLCTLGIRYQPEQTDQHAPPAPTGVNPLITAMLPDILAGIGPTMAKMVADGLATVPSKTHDIRITQGDKTRTVPLGLAHRTIPTLIRTMTPSFGHAWVYGPRGSGKTTAARQVAKALGAAFNRDDYRAYCFSANEAMLPHDLFGFKSPIDGTVHRTEFFTAVTEGHLFLLDEGDTCPGLITQLNMLLDSDYAVFPDGEHRVHTHFRLMVGANTAGGGATAEYSARQRMDKALTDRFAFIHWDYDEALELAIVESFGDLAVKWAKHVFAIRKAIKAMGEAAPDCYPSPRATFKGSRELQMFGSAVTFAELEAMYIWRDVSPDDVTKVKKNLR